MADPYVVTKAGYEKLHARLKYIKEVERPQNVRDIEEARAHGDLSENAEFHAAKERQAFLEGEKNMLGDKLGRAQVIDPATMSGDKVVFGATVELLNVDTDEEVTYQIVGADEGDIKQGRVSYVSPIARALIGREEGDEVDVQTPGGERSYEILSVEFK